MKIHNESKDVVSFIKEVIYNYEPKIDKLVEKEMNELSKDMFENLENPNRPLFSAKTAKKIMEQMNEEKMKLEE